LALLVAVLTARTPVAARIPLTLAVEGLPDPLAQSRSYGRLVQPMGTRVLVAKTFDRDRVEEVGGRAAGTVLFTSRQQAAAVAAAGMAVGAVAFTG
jgi:hypothetical protein